MTVLLIEGDGLPLYRRDYFPRLREMRAAVRVVRVFYEMRSYLPAVFQVDLGFARAGSWNRGRG